RLYISVPVVDLTQLGRVSSIFDQLVVIESFTQIPALDLDTVLFSKDGSALGIAILPLPPSALILTLPSISGKIFDVIGPVRHPKYVLRFNSVDEIVEAKLETDTPIYYTTKTVYQEYQEPVTKYVFVQPLLQEKGSDASWKHNNEPPPELVDYSDDEVE